MTQQTRIRNLGIIAHVDAGKTTLTERILFYAGRIHRIGNVDEGNTQTDSNAIEKKMGITITAAAVRCAWRDSALNLIDTPGHADFNIEVERSLRVLDGAVVLLDGVAGVEPQTEKVWRQADRYGVPRVLFVNKLDRVGASFARCLDEVRERLGGRPVVVGLPFGEETSELGLLDVVRMRALRWTDDDGESLVEGPIEAPLQAAAENARADLVLACAEVEPRLLETFVERGDVSNHELVDALRRGTHEGQLVPALGGSAFKNRGVQPLLDAVLDYLPDPAVSGGPLVAFCFKVVFDRFGQLGFVRVYEGELRKGAKVAISGSDRPVRVGRLVRVFADSVEEVDTLGPGEIGAVVGGELRTGQTVSDLDAPVTLDGLTVPEPVVRLAIEPVGRDDRDRLGEALSRALAEDPSLSVHTDDETGQTILAGIGQLHLEIVVERLKLEHGVSLRAGRPKVAYRETVSRLATHELKYKKQTGGPGQYAHVVLQVGPAAPGAGFVFEHRIKGGAIRAEYISGVRKGVVEAMTAGVLGGYPVTDVEVVLLDGSQHSNDSSEMAFAAASSIAFREACAAAGPTLLEPLVKLEVLVPGELVGAVLGDLGARRADVLAMSTRGTTHVLDVAAPLAELFGYADRLSTLTHGRGQYAMSFHRYAPAPASFAARVVA